MPIIFEPLFVHQIKDSVLKLFPNPHPQILKMEWYKVHKN
jgi:hypothetical protein